MTPSALLCLLAAPILAANLRQQPPRSGHVQALSAQQPRLEASQGVFDRGQLPGAGAVETGVCANCGLTKAAEAEKLTVGVVREIKANEKRVGLTPEGVKALTHLGIPVVVERGAGENSAFSDAEYENAGARMLSSAQEVFKAAGLIKHVKELQPSEYGMLRPDHVVFTYNHFEEDAALTKRSVDSKAAFVSYEKVVVDGKTPLLAPMSRIAGYLAARWTNPAGKDVVVLGGGVAGEAAAREAVAMGASEVTITEFSAKRRAQLEAAIPGIRVMDSQHEAAVRRVLKAADVIVGTVYVKGRAPVLIGPRGMLDEGKPVPYAFEDIAGGKPKQIVDISVDQGGNAAYVKPDGSVSHEKTSHDKKSAVDRYGNSLFRVPNMPAAMPRKASIDLEEATLPYLTALALGVDRAIKERPELLGGLSIRDGLILDDKVRAAHGEVKAPAVVAPAAEEKASEEPAPPMWALLLLGLFAAALVALIAG